MKHEIIALGLLFNAVAILVLAAAVVAEKPGGATAGGTTPPELSTATEGANQ